MDKFNFPVPTNVVYNAHVRNPGSTGSSKENQISRTCFFNFDFLSLSGLVFGTAWQFVFVFIKYFRHQTGAVKSRGGIAGIFVGSTQVFLGIFQKFTHDRGVCTGIIGIQYFQVCIAFYSFGGRFSFHNNLSRRTTRNHTTGGSSD